MKNCLLRSFQALLVFSLAFTLTNCGNLDNPLEELSGGSGSGSSVSVTSITVDLSKIDEKYLDTEKTKLQLTVGDEVTLSFTILPAEMASTEVELTSADATILSIDGLKVKALKEGETKVTAKAGDKTAECTVIVKDGYLKWDNTKKELVATPMPDTYTTVEEAGADVSWPAGTYVVEGDVEINDYITLDGNVDLIIKDGAKLTAMKILGDNHNLSIYGQANQSGKLVVHNPDAEAIVNMVTFEVHSCQVTANCSMGNYSSFYNIATFNVYGGSVDAENTSFSGFGIWLADDGSMNIYGGDLKAVGKGSQYGLGGNSSSTVTVYGGKLRAENAEYKAIDFNKITLTKGAGFTGKIEYSMDNTDWSEIKDTNAKYVRVGY